MEILKNLILILFVFSFSTFSNATVKIPASVFLKKLFHDKESLFFEIEISDESDEKLLWFLKPYYQRIGELGIELNDKKRCRYHTRKNLLKADNQNDWDCFYALRHMIRDTKKCLPHPNKVFSNEKLTQTNIKGRIRYVGVAPLPYRYKLENKNNRVELFLTVGYKNWTFLTDEEKATLQRKFQEGTSLWNKNNPGPGKFKLNVSIEEDHTKADFVVNAVDGSTRGPYLKEHSIDWPSRVFAHEFGHMLGLDDEYDQIFATLFKRSRCTSKSLMCSSYYEYFPKHYWYLIFRRGYCS